MLVIDALHRLRSDAKFGKKIRQNINEGFRFTIEETTEEINVQMDLTYMVAKPMCGTQIGF